jgi:hypothetical protein
VIFAMMATRVGIGGREGIRVLGAFGSAMDAAANAALGGHDWPRLFRLNAQAVHIALRCLFSDRRLVDARNPRCTHFSQRGSAVTPLNRKRSSSPLPSQPSLDCVELVIAHIVKIVQTICASKKTEIHLQSAVGNIRTLGYDRWWNGKAMSLTQVWGSARTLRATAET